MGVYICPRCDAVKESKDGDCIPALPESKNELVCEGCATDEELHAYLPGVYPDPDDPDPLAWVEDACFEGQGER